HFPEIRSATQGCQLFLFAFSLAENIALALLDDIHAITQVTLLEDDVAGLEMLVADARLKGCPGLRQLRWEEQMEEPVGGDPGLAIEPRHLHQINATP